MKLALTKPSTILVVASAGQSGEDLRRAAEGCDGADVTVVESVAGARERVEADGVACIAVGDVDGDVAAFVSSVDPDIPVLYCPSDADEDTVAAVAAAGGRYVPRADGPRDHLVDAMGDAIERYQARWTSAKESAILDAMLSDLDVALYAKDEEARHVKVADVRGGPAPEEQYGKTDRELFGDDHPFDSDGTYQDDVRVIETGEPIREKLHRHGEDAPLWLRETKVPWRDENGSVVGLVGISVNVTQMREQIETLERQIGRLENFVSHAHHDLRNPLQVATGHLSLARQQEDDEAALDKIEGALDRTEEMLDDLRQTSQGGVGFTTDVEMTGLSRVVDDVWRTLETESAALDVAFPEGTEIRATESDVRPLLENLLKNAVEHGGPSVTVTVGALEDGFYVADDGPGIPVDERDEVLKEGYTTADSGSGSGLAIVSDVAVKNEWDLAVTESESGGARFEFRNAMLVTDPPEAAASGATHQLDEAVDVGSITAGERGRYDADEDRWTIEADGANVWRDENDFHYVFTRVSGDVRIEGRVRDVEPVHQYSKAGFMLRGGTDEDSAYCHLGATALRGSEVLWRGRHGEPGRSQLVGDDPGRFEYYRVERVGDTVTCSVSKTGSDWQAIDQRPVDFDDEFLVGIAVCSVSPRYPTTAIVEDVTVTSLAPSANE